MKLEKIILLVVMVFLFILSKFLLWWSFLVSLFLSLSLWILYFLWKINWKWRVFWIITWLIFLSIDFFLLLLLLLPTKSYSINTKNYYAKRVNYLKIYPKWNKKEWKYMLIMIKRNWKWMHMRLSEYPKWLKIILKQNDKIYFAGNRNNKSYAIIYLWDDTIFRITPWTKLSLKKITKNLNNLPDSKTNIALEQWSLWFHIVRLIKDSKSMNIQTWTGQTLIIRWTEWFVKKDMDKTYAIDYSHYIEVKNKDKSKLLKQWQWAIIENNNISVIENLESLFKKIGINKKTLDQFNSFDQKQIKKFNQELINYIKKQVWDKQYFSLLAKLDEIKLKIFSIWDKKYKEKLNNLINYEYLTQQWKNFANSLVNNPNLSFIASSFGDQKAKVEYLYNQLKQNLKNSDIYKTYIINLWIEGKIKNVWSFLNKTMDNYSQDFDNLKNEIFNK